MGRAIVDMITKSNGNSQIPSQPVPSENTLILHLLVYGFLNYIGQFGVNYESIWNIDLEDISMMKATLLLSLSFIRCSQSLQCYYCDIQNNVTCPGMMR